MARRLQVLLLTALLMLPVPGTSAGHKTSHSGGGSQTQLSEEDDGDGVGDNIVDEGDNLHPSGKDRSVEKGGAGDQGRSGSDPDKLKNRGVDKPGGAGGVDIYDQDYNNGCGNDDDFEDDNNGNCFGRRGGDDGNGGNGGNGGGGSNGGDTVLGSLIGRGEQGALAAALGSLAFTGAEVVPLAIIAALALLAGAIALRGGRRRDVPWPTR